MIAPGQWTAERARAWYDAQPWPLGFNGYPSNCVNRVAMWQTHRHAEVFAQIAREFDLARDTGFNAVRALVQFEVWRDERAAFLAHLDEYLDLAAARGLRVMLCLGNDCCPPRARYRYELGEQPVEWGYHSGTKASPHSGDFREAVLKGLSNGSIPRGSVQAAAVRILSLVAWCLRSR